MKHLVATLSNQIYRKDKETGEFEKFHELIIVSDESEYARANNGELIQNRRIKKHSFILSQQGIDELIESLNELKKLE